MSVSTAANLFVLAIGLSVLVFTAYSDGSDLMAMTRSLLRRRRWPALVACLLTTGLVCGAIHAYETRGSIQESHVVDEYRFEITSERDLAFERSEGYIQDDVSVSVYQEGRLLAGPIYIGHVNPPAGTSGFTVRRLPSESLIIVTRTDREKIVVFAFDTATGEACPGGVSQTYEVYREQTYRFESRVRACLGCEQFRLRNIGW